MSRKEDVPNRRYTLEYKIEAVRRSESIGGSQAAKRLEIPRLGGLCHLKSGGKRSDCRCHRAGCNQMAHRLPVKGGRGPGPGGQPFS
jgi:hypothetical protein